MSSRLATALAGLALLVSSACVAPSLTHSLEYRDLAGEMQAPLEVGDRKANVIVFITTDCPIANQYSPTIRDLCKAYADKPLAFYLVHVDPDIDVAKAKKHASDYGHVCPVLLDPTHRLVERCGAKITPEAVVLTRDGDIAYRGRIDNLYSDLGKKRRAPTRHELRDAIDAVLAGREVAVKRSEAVGCFIPDR